MDYDQAQSKKPSISRRAFLAGAGSVFTALAAPIVAGQRVPGVVPAGEQDPLAALGPEVAYAEDAGTFEFEVAKPSEIAIKVVDVAAKDMPPVKGARVTLKSLDTDAGAITVTTGDNGIAVADIKDLCDPKRATLATDYLCDLSVKVRADGCRQVNIESRQAIGGTACVLPTCSIMADSYRQIPYFRSVSFNGRDVQYTTATFMHSSGNNARHEISAGLYLKGAGEARVQVWRWTPESDVFPGLGNRQTTLLCELDASISDSKAQEYRRLDEADEAARAAGGDYDVEAYEDRWVRNVSVKERFLQTSFDRSFEAGDRLVMRIFYDGWETIYLTSARFRNAPLDKVSSGAADLLPGLGSSSLEFTIPKLLPGIGGAKFKVWTPTLPFLVVLNPLGYLMAGFTLYSAEGESEKNPFKKDNWEKGEAESFKEQCKEFDKKYEKRKAGFKSMYNDWKSPSGNNQTKRMQCKMFPKFEASVAAQFYADLAFDIDDMKASENVWRGGLNLVAGVSGEGNIVFQALVGPIPLFLNLNPSADLTLSLRAGWNASLPGDDRPLSERMLEMITESNISWADNQVAFVLNIGFAVTAGVGVSGVASVGVRGSAGITGYVALYDGSGHGAEGTYTWPHARVGAGMDLAVAVQAWIFKYSKKIIGKEWPTLYDSWGIDADAASLLDGDPEAEPTATGMPAAFALGGATVQAADTDDELEPDENGNYVITLEELAENAQPVTEGELLDTAEFRAQVASVAALDAEEDLDLVAREVEARELTTEDGETIQTMAGYSLTLVSADEAAGGVAALSDGEAAGPNDPTSGADFREQPELDPDDFEEVEGKLQDVDPDAEAASISGVAEAGGVTPSIDVPILRDVFSDGRPRMATIGADGSRLEVMLRIATGTYDGKPRSRLVAQIRRNILGMRVWSPAIPVEFAVDGLGDIRREDLYDYDFDVCECEGYLVVMLLSGTRSENTDFLSACTSSVTTILTLGRKPSTNLGVFWARSWMSFDHGSSYGDGEELYLTYSPCISCARTDTYIYSKDYSAYYIAGALIYKRGVGKAVLSSDTPAQAAGFLFRAVAPKDISKSPLWGTTENQTFVVPGIPASTTSLAAAGGSAGIQSSRPTGERADFYVAYESAEGCGTFPIQALYKYSGPTGSPELLLYQTYARAIPGTKKLYPWRGGEATYLAIDERGVLCKVDVYGNLVPISPYREQVDADGRQQMVCDIPPDFTLSPDGSMLVFAENKEGIDGFDYDGVGQDGKPGATYQEGRYRIMASRAVKHTVAGQSVTLFTRPFALCELPHAVDRVTSATIDGATVRIVASTVTSLLESKSDYYEIKVPVVACVTATSMAASTGSLFPGETVSFEVTLRNDGNARLSSATLTLCDESGRALAEGQKVDFGPDTVVFCTGAKADESDPMADPVFDSCYHNDGGLDADAFSRHPLVADGGRDCLSPGCTATVKMPFTVPDDWSGTKKLRVDVSGFTFASPVTEEARAVTLDAGAAGVTAECGTAGIAGVSGFDAEDLFAEKRTVELTVGETASGSASGLNAFAVKPLAEGEDPGNPDDPNGKDKDKKEDKDKDKDKLPDTGDASLLGGAAGALLGVGGLAMAGLAAYSRRRAENESADRVDADEE